jgi:sRNA-binding regulator protein Hfq
MNLSYDIPFSTLFERIILYAQRADLPQPSVMITLVNGQVFTGQIQEFYTHAKEQYAVIKSKDDMIN